MAIVKNKENIGMLFVFRLVFWFFFKTFLFFYACDRRLYVDFWKYYSNY